MSIIKEVGARFTATDKGITSAFKGIEDGLDNVLKKSEKFNKKSGDVFKGIEKKAGKISSSFNKVGTDISSLGSPIQNIGGNLTDWITKPALVAGGALAAMFGGLGVKRLIGLDNAKAKLEGMGYSAQEVEGITTEVTEAIAGGMMTMAEGTDTAAGAMAAGVEQGEELARYLQLVDAAAVGANRPVNEMAMIFNRVQGSGKLMTEELNMIEDSMPGFSSTLAEHLNVPYEEMRKMVTEGEVTSEQFLDVMEGYAGGAAEAYSKTFAGMGKNALAYVGILGETMLETVFEDGKEGMARLIELLKSPEALAAAQRIGEALKTALDKIVGFIRQVVNWWQSLDDETRSKFLSIGKWIGIIGVAIGPILTAIGSLIIFFGALFTAAGTIISAVGTVASLLGKFIGVVGTVVGWVTRLLGIIKFLGQMFFSLMTPVGWVVTAIAALAAAFILAYNKSATFRNFIDGLKDKFVSAWQSMVEFKDRVIAIFTAIFAMFKGDWTGGVAILEKLGMSDEQILKIQNAVLKVRYFFHQLKENVTTILMAIGNFFSTIFNFIKSVVSTSMNFIRGTIVPVLQNIMQVVGTILTGIYNVFSTIFNAVWTVVKFIFGAIYNSIKFNIETAKYIIEFTLRLIYTIFKTIFNLIRTVVSTVLTFIVNFISTNFNRMKNIITVVMTAIRTVMSTIWNAIRNVVMAIVNPLINMVRNAFNRLRSALTSIMNTIRSVFSTVWNAIRNVVMSIVTPLINRVRSAFNSLRNALSSILNTIRNVFSTVWNTIRNTVTRIATSIFNALSNTFNNIKNRLSTIMNTIKSTITSVWESVKTTFSNVADGIYDAVTGAFEKMKETLSDIIDGISGFIDDMVDGVKKGLNKLIDGVNWVADKIGMDKLPQIALSTGTTSTNKHNNLITNGKINRDTFATVGDRGRGNGTGGFRNEMIRYPNGKMILTPDTDTTAYLPKGSMVFNGKQTQQIMPQFSTGTLMDFMGGAGETRRANKGMQGDFKDNKVGNTRDGKGINKIVEDNQGGIFKKIGSAVKSVIGKAGDIIGDVMDYIKDPSKLVDKVFDAFGLDFGFLEGSLFNDALTGMIGKLKSGIATFFKGGLESAGSGDGSSFTGYKKTTKYSPNAPVPGYPTSFNGGRHYGIDYGTPSGVTLKATNTGTVSKMNDRGGGLVAKLLTGKFTQFFLHLSSILKTGKVKQGEPFAKTGNSGQWTTGPHLHYQVEKGNSPWVTNRNTIDPEKYLKGIKGYAKGDVVTSPQLAWLAEGGFSESIISHDPKYQSRSKAIYDRTGEMLGFNDDETEFLLSQILLQTKKGNNIEAEQAKLLRDIFNKDNTQSSSELYRRFKDYEKSKNKTNRTTKGRV